MTAPQTTIATGTVRGRMQGDIAAFWGVPFAAPPVGPRRLAPPAPVEPWDGVREAVEAGSIAPQNPSMLEQMLGAGEADVSEDCLHLNVFTPGCDDAARPVMVWIHGGGYLTGTGSIPWYDGTRLAGRDVVVVTINYRLGVLGYLHLDEIGPGFEGSGNLGLLDQVAALEWVRDNIAAFGGDPGKVTIFGESAGAMSVAALLATPRAEGLFRRAILQSGAGAHVHAADEATAVARKFLAEVGIGEGDLERLRDVPLTDLLAAQARFCAAYPFEAGLPFQPVVEGAVLPDRPTARIAAGSADGVDVLVGTNLEEMKMFLLIEPALQELDEEALGSRADDLFVSRGHAPGEALEVYRRSRADAPVTDVLSAILSDHTFRIPAIRVAEAQAARHPGVWMYMFAFKSPSFGGVLGSCHALEIPFVWDNLDAQAADLFAGEATDGMRRLSQQLADAWVAFARDGVPAADGVPGWPRYEVGRRATMWLDDTGAEVVDDPMSDERELWQGHGH